MPYGGGKDFLPKISYPPKFRYGPLGMNLSGGFLGNPRGVYPTCRMAGGRIFYPKFPTPQNSGMASGEPFFWGSWGWCCGAGTDTLRWMFLSSLRGTENVGSSVSGTPKGILGCCCGAGTDTLRGMFLSSLRGTENVGSSVLGTPKGILGCCCGAGTDTLRRMFLS